MAPTTATTGTTPKKWEEFADKMEWEGGLLGVLEYGGVDIFPKEARPAAAELESAIAKLCAVLAAHGVDTE